MWKTFKVVNKIENTIKINGFFYALQHLPVIKTLLKNVSYSNYNLKNKLTIVAVILNVLQQLLIVSVSFLLGVGFVLLQLEKYAPGIRTADAFMSMFFWFYFILGGLTNIIAFERSENRYICVKRFQMDAKQYFLVQFILKHIENLVGELIVFTPVLLKFKINFLQIIVLLLIKELFGAFGEMLHILLYEKTKWILYKNMQLSVFIKIIIIACGYGSIFLFRNFTYSSTVIIAIGTIACLLGMIGMLYLLKYNNYHSICMEMDRLDELTLDVEGIQRSMDLNKIHRGKSQDLRGSEKDEDISSNPFAYLNNLFFDRHKEIIYKSGRVQAVIFIVIGILFFVVKMVYQGLQMPSEELVAKYAPNVILIIYGMSNGNKVTKAMFYNCDFSMLRYGFYKTRIALLAGYLTRMRKLILSNLLPAGTLCIVLALVGYSSNISIKTLLILSVLIMELAALFAVHELFMYYMLQPYSSEKRIVKPTYTIVQMVTGAVCFSCAQVSISLTAFLVIFCIVTILYIILSACFVFRWASKTFSLW